MFFHEKSKFYVNIIHHKSLLQLFTSNVSLVQCRLIVSDAVCTSVFLSLLTSGL